MEEVTRRLCAFGMRAGIFPRRDLLSRFIARVVPTSMARRERERERGGDPLPASVFGTGRKEEKVG